MDPVARFAQGLALAAGSGLFLATVTSLDDPLSRNRVRVRLAAISGSAQQDAEIWARVAAPFAGNDRGAFWMPDIEDEVVVAFVQGDARLPIVLGGLWNGASRSPETLGSSNNLKVVRSRAGNRVLLDDTPGQERVIVETPGGSRLTLSDAAGDLVRIEDSAGNAATMGSGGVAVSTPTTVKVEAAARVEVRSAMVQVDAALSRFSGVVQCDTLVASSVISATYTPGGGNIW